MIVLDRRTHKFKFQHKLRQTKGRTSEKSALIYKSLFLISMVKIMQINGKKMLTINNKASAFTDSLYLNIETV